MLGIMAVMNQKDSFSRLYNAGIAGGYAPRAVFLGGQAQDVRHHGRFGPEGQWRYSAHVPTAETVEFPQLQSFQVVDIFFIPQRPGFSADQRDSPVAVRFLVVDAPVSRSSSSLS